MKDRPISVAAERANGAPGSGVSRRAKRPAASLVEKLAATVIVGGFLIILIGGTGVILYGLGEAFCVMFLGCRTH